MHCHYAVFPKRWLLRVKSTAAIYINVMRMMKDEWIVIGLFTTREYSPLSQRRRTSELKQITFKYYKPERMIIIMQTSSTIKLTIKTKKTGWWVTGRRVISWSITAVNVIVGKATESKLRGKPECHPCILILTFSVINSGMYIIPCMIRWQLLLHLKIWPHAVLQCGSRVFRSDTTT